MKMDSKQKKELMEKYMRVNALLYRYYVRGRRHPGTDPHRGQGRVLSILKMKPEISQKELAYILDMRNQSLGELLKKLERSGYITRTQSEEDKRSMNIQLTDEGMNAANQLLDSGQMDGLMDCLTDEEQQKLNQILDKLELQLQSRMEDDDDRPRRHHRHGRGMAGRGWGMMHDMPPHMHGGGMPPHMAGYAEDIPDILWYEDFEKQDPADGSEEQ